MKGRMMGGIYLSYSNRWWYFVQITTMAEFYENAAVASYRKNPILWHEAAAKGSNRDVWSERKILLSVERLFRMALVLWMTSQRKFLAVSTASKKDWPKSLSRQNNFSFAHFQLLTIPLYWKNLLCNNSVVKNPMNCFRGITSPVAMIMNLLFQNHFYIYEAQFQHTKCSHSRQLSMIIALCCVMLESQPPIQALKF